MASTLNLGTVKTPGVYIDEMSLFPPSVAQVDTAIPAFIGPTRQHRKDGQSVQGQPVRIASMVEYRSYFGGAPDRNLAVTIDAAHKVQNVQAAASPYLYDSLQLYFANGGEKCYVVSTGTYNDPLTDATPFTDALTALAKFDEPTLIVMPDAVRLPDGQLATVQQAALSHCHSMQDRFAILDVKMANPYAPQATNVQAETEAFRENVSDYPNYGAAYYPYLQTNLPLTVSLNTLAVTSPDGNSFEQATAHENNGPLVQLAKGLSQDLGTVQAFLPNASEFAGQSGIDKKTYLQVQSGLFNNLTFDGADALVTDYKNGSAALHTAIDNLSVGAADFDAQADSLFSQLNSGRISLVGKMEQQLASKLAELKSKSPVYAAIVAAAEAQGAIVPPSGAVAGAYARTDADRGVWKSPANVGLSYVAGPVVRLTDSEQENLNVDVVAGKSINAIRAFTGKGTLVWGGRTLAGSDNEWRYVAVRRFFLMAEESIKKATAQFVFEANDANTWVRVRAMIENFLTLQWRAGALAGVKAENAFFVRVGLGQTMTPQDVLNGFMIIEIGMAVVRPAEFIVLRFSHKMQEA